MPTSVKAMATEAVLLNAYYIILCTQYVFYQSQHLLVICLVSLYYHCPCPAACDLSYYVYVNLMLIFSCHYMVFIEK